MAYQFLRGNWWSYISRAFEFSRVFLYKWTVNWRFVGEALFYSTPFSYALLGAHVLLLYICGLTRWLEPAKLSSLSEAIGYLVEPPPADVQAMITRRVTPKYVLTTVLSAMHIGCLCARSLHYQFFVYIAWSTPFLLWRSGLHPILIYAICITQEWAWNVYPSTNLSSMVVVGSLAVTLLSVWVGTSPFLQLADGSLKEKPQHGEESHEHAE